MTEKISPPLYKIYLFATLLGSCSGLIKQDNKDQILYTAKKEHHRLFCPAPQTFENTSAPQARVSLAGGTPGLQEDFQRFLNTVQSKKLTFEEKATLWALVQMYARPDLASPTSRIQLLGRGTSQQWSIEDYKQTKLFPESEFPYLWGLSNYLKKSKSTLGMSGLARLLDQNFHHQYQVDKSFGTFLQMHQELLVKESTFKNIYVKGDQVLRNKESYKTPSFTQLLALFSLSKPKEAQKLVPQIPLFDYREKLSSGENRFVCNFDPNLYENSIYIINDQIYDAHNFALQEDDKVFLAVSSQRLPGKDLSPLKNTLFFKGSSLVRSSSLCYVYTAKKSEFFLLSSLSRDPSQHLFHFFHLGPEDIETQQEFALAMQGARHEFLNNPIRLQIESQRAQGAQMERILGLNFPLYHARALGRIWAYMQSTKSKGIILDDRDSATITCQGAALKNSKASSSPEKLLPNH